MYTGAYYYTRVCSANLIPGRRFRRSQRKATLLKCHEDEILPLDQRSLPFDHLSSMGCIEANVGELIALRMKSRGCSWSRADAITSIMRRFDSGIQ